MTFNDTALFALVMLGGALLLIGVIVAGSVSLSFMAHARPIPEPTKLDREAPAKRASI